MFIWLQYITPQKLVTKVVGGLAGLRLGWLTRCAIAWFVRHYRVDMSEALEPDIKQYPSFNDFFTRALKEDARPIDSTLGGVSAPADGCVSAFGRIREGTILQAKGYDYTVQSLVGGSKALARPFLQGAFITEYLSPRDYHRVHMPVSAKLLDMVYVPGCLFSVNQEAVQGVPGLFARNERVVCIFETEYGRLALVMVGAMIVGNIELGFAGPINVGHHSIMELWHYESRNIQYAKGDELGRFNMGSTVILLFEHQDVSFIKDLQPGVSLQMGQALAKFCRPDVNVSPDVCSQAEQ